MNLLITSNEVSRKYSISTVDVASDEHDIASSLTEQVTDSFSAADGDDGDSIAEVEDGLAQVYLRQINKVPSDTADSALSTSDTLSSYSDCSVGGVSEPFVAVFGGVQEVLPDDDRNNDGNDDDSAVHVCNADGSISGSVTDSQDHGSEHLTSSNTTVSDAVDNMYVDRVENGSLSWY